MAASNPTGNLFDEAVEVQAAEHLGTRYELINPRSLTTMVRVFLDPGHPIRAVPGCMVAHSESVNIQGKLKKSFKTMFGPDEARHQTMTAIEKPGWVLLAPGFYGDLRAVTLSGDMEVYISDGSFLACTDGVTTTSVRQDVKKSMFSGSGLFVKKAKGNGVVFVGGVGSIMEWNLNKDQVLTVDNDHVVLWSKGIGYELTKASAGLRSTALSGEGMVSKFTGPGRVWCHARNAAEIAKWVYSTVPPAVGA
ncbi:hypothetical protein BWQ96_02187 [Gracilariopsis chorda]|uniref:Uncharacterized protein n=1 Tax=Gracilariopsis chorda TaxID=448386 RepID=A0A2V3J0Q7_9FLOR|nr:hypothetical protein BWQ96_02187 [Gracilariopsis chorda]|eukprot:PXF47996.1 hypothetical protein BWQ96_02187 [Gracilariopsis chorda]